MAVHALDDTPIAVLSIIGWDRIGVTVSAVNAYGRPLTAAVPWESTTTAGIDAALREAWRMAVELDRDREAALYAMSLESGDPFVLADDDPRI